MSIKKDLYQHMVFYKKMSYFQLEEWCRKRDPICKTDTARRALDSLKEEGYVNPIKNEKHHVVGWTFKQPNTLF